MDAFDANPEGQSLTTDDLDILRAALASRPEWSDLAQVLGAAARSQASDRLMALAAAFSYDLVDREQRRNSSDRDVPFVPGWLGLDPTPLSDTPVSRRTIWRAARDAMGDPIVTSRIGDLLYVAEGKQAAHRDGRDAAGALMQIARDDAWQPIGRAPCVSRALEILAELGDDAALSGASGQAVELVDDLLTEEHFGPPIIVLRAIAALKPRQRPADLDDLFDRVLERYPSGNSGDAVYQLAESTTQDVERRSALRARQVQARIDQARDAEGLVKATHLHRAFELARHYGRAAEAKRLLQELQEIPYEELGLRTHEFSVEIPAAELQAEAERIAGCGAKDLIDALTGIGAYPPPGGSNADMDAELASYPRSFVTEIFGTTVFDGHGAAPLYTANDPESKLRWERAQARARHAGFFGYALCGPMIDIAVKRHGHPSHVDLAAHFSTPLIGTLRGERIARSIELFWDREYDASAHLLVPRIESILRDLARNSGITIVKAADRDLGGIATLGTVLRKLREHYPDWEWFDYLEALLCEPLSMNLRNAIAHGLVGTVDGTSAALLIHVACWLAVLGRADERDEALDDRGSRSDNTTPPDGSVDGVST